MKKENPKESNTLQKHSPRCRAVLLISPLVDDIPRGSARPGGQEVRVCDTTIKLYDPSQPVGHLLGQQAIDALHWVLLKMFAKLVIVHCRVQAWVGEYVGVSESNIDRVRPIVRYW